MRRSALPPRPSALGDAVGLWAGPVTTPPEGGRSRRGRLRRWSYSAAGGLLADGMSWLVGAAVVVVGPAATAFAFGRVGEERLEWSSVRPALGATGVGHVPTDGAVFGDVVRIDEHGGLDVTTPTGWRVRTRVGPDTPAVCATPTPGGGWNVTQKVAGEAVQAKILTPQGQQVDGHGAGWRDWTAGRQDRHTTWTWAAGATAGPTRIGWNASTGMNGTVGEDVFWIDGRPHALDGASFGPVDTTAGVWTLEAPGLSIGLWPEDVRMEEQRLLLATSRYVQPYGRWSGMLLLDDEELAIDGTGVAEDHEVRW